MKDNAEAGMAFAPLHEPSLTGKPMTETELNARIEEIRAQRNDNTVHMVKRRTGRRYRRQMCLKKTARLRKIVIEHYVPHAGYVQWECIDGEWLPAGKYIKYPKNSNCQKWCKRETSKKMRNAADVPGKGNYYRKLFDYWWMLY